MDRFYGYDSLSIPWNASSSSGDDSVAVGLLNFAMSLWSSRVRSSLANTAVRAWAFSRIHPSNTTTLFSCWTSTSPPAKSKRPPGVISLMSRRNTLDSFFHLFRYTAQRCLYLTSAKLTESECKKIRWRSRAKNLMLRGSSFATATAPPETCANLSSGLRMATTLGYRAATRIAFKTFGLPELLFHSSDSSQFLRGPPKPASTNAWASCRRPSRAP
mmetsp:Transcript_15864/g.39285  ORF Transcript_15864/g.39285 Transcript_15864/m.39285 type:complete len:216 (+) Transcript_15864:95-742(+)